MRVLIVDDEKNLRKSIASYLTLENIEVREAENGLSAQRLLEEEAFDCIVLDLKMPGISGLDFLDWLREKGPSIPAVMISAFGNIDDAVKAMKLGASDYLVKPFDPDELLIRVNRAVAENRMKRQAALAASLPHEETESRIMRDIYHLVDRAAPSDATILITGESGTGKEVLAKRIHEKSLRSEGPFIPINLGGIPENLVESELFGYEKGAFTGAEHRKEGMFEYANGGTLFLDEIGDMPLHLQVKLLRVIQDRKIQRLGGALGLPIDVRLIAATNKDLASMVAEKTFREDLYYRLNVIHIELPALRDRKEDIPLLAGSLLKKLSIRSGKRITGITTDALKLLESYSFPGNIRELENLIERALILCEGDTLTPRDFSLPETARKDLPEKQGTLAELEREAIRTALLRNDGRKMETANELGISRRTLLNKIKEFGL
ncbi:MAG TPA: sigma-54 dependent transcriptional regulator [Spirochaetia bacterium]|nr:sigma-54 dependent transcriptional regulator [Spirochaetia bacterium]